MPARITEPGVGASTCASGNQRWNGIRGILTEKPRKRKRRGKTPLMRMT